MKKTITLTTGKTVELTILKQDDGFTQIDTDIDITEEEADEIADMDF